MSEEDKAREQFGELFGKEAPSDYKDGDPIKFFELDRKTVTAGIYRYSQGVLQVGKRETVPTYAIEVDGGLRYIPKTRIVS